jgi:CDGSH-type Zn-finger protein/uncharacterized Fe-S cluster protein YjdI
MTATTEMSEPAIDIAIEHREQLLYLLAEAAEIEHCLMGCYLYAAFSLKRDEGEGLEPHELDAVRRWRRRLLHVAVEEMGHLALVWNLTAAIGGGAHVGRPNFPVAAGFFPSGVVATLQPFCADTIAHFVYLERPREVMLESPHVVPSDYVRHSTAGRLMPSAQDYATVGELYQAVRDGLRFIAARCGEARLFCGRDSTQITTAAAALPGLRRVVDLASAQEAIDTIVTQGEGASRVVEGSHFAIFSEVAAELAELRARRPGFEPARPVAANPVMRRPPSPQGKVWVDEPRAAAVLDAANSAYALMLRLLSQAVGRAPAEQARCDFFVGRSLDAMHAVTALAEQLTRMPATREPGSPHAGITFAMLRDVAPLGGGSAEGVVLRERAKEVAVAVRALAAPHPALAPAAERLERLAAALAAAQPQADVAAAAEVAAPVARVATLAPVASKVEVAVGRRITIEFEAARCIHSRGCVLSWPQVFKANTLGDWLVPDAVEPQGVVEAAHQCPSGAIRYRWNDGSHPETAPPVNTLHLRENGPLAVHAELHVAGQPAMHRATLCRCGRSQNKPFCDGSHHGAGFVATGEPVTLPTEALARRDGPLVVTPLRNGPLVVEGPVEICAGTGRTVARVASTRLCRCGQSANKPFCDGSHAHAGFEAAGATA